MKKEEPKNKVYDFTKVQVIEVDKTITVANISKIVGNVLYCSTPDIAAMDKAREIYHKGKAELSPKEAAYYLEIIMNSPAIVGPFKIALQNLLK